MRIRANEGFTLLELVLLASCSAIVLFVAVPSVEALQQSWSLWGATQLVQSSLQWGRMRAIAGNTSMMFTVEDNGTRFYWTDPVTDQKYQESMRFLPGRIRIASSPKRSLRFYPKGNAVPAGSYVLQGPAGSFRVIVNAAGRIRTERVP